jgi:hypothetical protein
MATLLQQITYNPDILHNFFMENNLTPIFKEQSDFMFNFMVENKDSFLWGKYFPNPLNQMAIYNFKFINDDLFYSIIMPNYTKSEIKQLITLLSFIDTLFDGEIRKSYNDSCSFTILPNHVYAENSYFQIDCFGLENFSLSTLHSVIKLDNLSFNCVYFSLLNNLKNKIDGYFNQPNMIIDNTVFKNMLNETHEEYINRTYINSLVHPISNNELTEIINQSDVKSVVMKSVEKKMLWDNTISIIDNRLIIDDSQPFIRMNICLDDLSILKKIFKNSMNERDVGLLINTLSMMFFYYKMTKRNQKIKDLSLTFSNNSFSSKTDIDAMDTLFFIEIGSDIFTFGHSIGINIVTNPTSPKIDTFEKFYQKQFNEVTSTICDILATDRDNITVKDFQVLDMALF